MTSTDTDRLQTQKRLPAAYLPSSTLYRENDIDGVSDSKKVECWSSFATLANNQISEGIECETLLKK